MLLKGFADCGRFKEAREVLDEMILSEVKPDAWTFSTLANAHVRGGDLSGAREVLRMALDAAVAGDLVSAYTAVLKGYAHAGQMEEVARLLNEMQSADVAPTDITLAALVDALIGNSQMDRALGFVDILSRQGVPITIAVKNNILSGLAKQNGISVREALQTLAELEAQDVMPNTDTYNILMSACCVAGQPAGARALFNRMMTADLMPDTVTYTTLMKAAIADDNYQAALQVFEELEDSTSGMEPDGVALNMLAFVLVSLERLPEARSVLDQVDAIAARTNTAPSVEGYGAVVMGFARKNLPEETVELMKRFRQRGGIPDQRMYNSVAGMYARSRDWTRALRVVKAMEQRGHEADRAMLISIIQRLEEAMEWEARQAEKLARGSNKSSNILRKAPVFNEGFERFKFWLGLPNRYYNASWDEEGLDE
uniref:Pentacotripeptide-repeat region of PRORP domain-containing protein n=1 Tax=Tetraselmis chuii TaxID=63592 RepID=A0A7S1SKZ4_9CHLO